MPDPISPSCGRDPAVAVALVCAAVSGGDLDAALAQYERGAALQPWAHDDPAGDGSERYWLAVLMELRLPVEVQVRAVLPAGGAGLVLSERQITGTGPDCQHVDLTGLGATVVRRQAGGAWRIAADAWQLAGPGAGAPG